VVVTVIGSAELFTVEMAESDSRILNESGLNLRTALRILRIVAVSDCEQTVHARPHFDDGDAHRHYLRSPDVVGLPDRPLVGMNAMMT
jgi:hypothetical protein